MKNVARFFGVAAWILATIGGFGYSLFIHKPLFAICIAITGGIAFPTVKKWIVEKPGNE